MTDARRYEAMWTLSGWQVLNTMTNRYANRRGVSYPSKDDAVRAARTFEGKEDRNE